MADDRPDEDADADEIAAWMEGDFWGSVADGVAESLDEHPDESSAADADEQ